MANKALDGAERKGREAFARGEPESACPYADLRTNNGRNAITFSRGFIRAWLRGHREAAKQSLDRKPTSA